MDISVFLAKAFGIYLVVLTFVMLFNKEGMQLVIKEMAKNPAMIFMLGVMTLILGILVVLSHNLWVMDKYLVITLLGWLMLVQGIVRMTYPTWVQKAAKCFTECDKWYNLTALLMLLLGLYLLNIGFNV